MNTIRKVHASKSGGMEFVLSDQTPDRMGDVIMADGWQLANFKKNPIALFNHKSDFPIGGWKSIHVEGDALVGKLELAPEGTSERLDEIRRLVEADVLRAVSVGFRPIESRPRGKDVPGEVFTKSELIETSLVSIPANPNALAIVKSLNISEDVQDLVFAEHGTKRQIEISQDDMGDYLKLNTLEQWSPHEARKAKLWMADLMKLHPYNPLYRKMHRLMDEIETVRIVSLVSAEHGSKSRAD